MPSGEQCSGNQHGESPTDEQGQPDEVPPTDGLPKNKGGEEDGIRTLSLSMGTTTLAGPSWSAR